MSSIHKNIKHCISQLKAGDLIFPTDFRGLGSEASIKMALSRLVKEGFIARLAHGIYYIPLIDPLLGPLLPAPEEIAESIARKEKVRIRPAGAYALNRLGLSMQVPTRLVYITDGAPRKLSVGKATILFKTTTPKKLATQGKISSLLIQALEELVIEKIDKVMERKIKELLLKEENDQLMNDLRLAPARINDYIVKLLKQGL